jgi:uncharacterized repeat protein (TIGR02543 family)
MLLTACGTTTVDEQPEAPTTETSSPSGSETEQPTVTMYTLTTSISPSGAGSISPLAEKYEEGSQVTLTATPASGYTFDYWDGDASGTSATITIIMDSDKSVIASFKEKEVVTYSLSVSVQPSGSGSVTPSSGDYLDGASVTLVATAAPGYTFDYWDGDASGTSATITIIMDSDKSVIASFKEDVTVDEQVVFEQDGITITVKSLDLEGSFFGPALKVLIENQTATNITVQVRNVTINDVMVDSLFSCDVASGKKANDEIIFIDSSLETAGIETIKDIEFEFHIFDADSWDTIFDSDTIKIRTSVEDSFMQEYDDSGFIAIDENGIKVVVKKLDSEDSFWGADVLVYIENNTAQDVTIQVRDVSVNGFMLSPVFSCDVLAGKKAFDSITFFESDLADNDITDIITIELSFHIFDADSWDTIFDSDTITISFQ